MIGNGKTTGIFPEEFPKGEETSLPDPQNLLDLPAIDLYLIIRSKQAFQLVVGKSLVNLSHAVLLGGDCSSSVHFSILDNSKKNLTNEKM